VQAVQGTLDGSRPDTSDAIFTIRRMASVRPNMESVSVVSVIALRARLDREAPEPSVAARVAHRVSVALVQHVAAKCFPALVRLPKLMVDSQRCDPSLLLGAGVATHRPLFLIATVKNVSTGMLG
jgi:poly-beta-hydroxyalkanoate depolymerase